MSEFLDGFAIELLLPRLNDLRTMKEVTSFSIFDEHGDYDPKGVFSEDIFTELGGEYRSKNLAYLDMRANIIHPLIYDHLCRSRKLYKEIIGCKVYAKWNEDEFDFEVSTQEEGRTGIEFFLEYYKDITKKTGELSPTREKFYKLLDKYQDTTMRYCLVIPAGIRDIEINDENRPEYDEINNLYLKLMSAYSNLPKEPTEETSLALSRTKGRIQANIHEIFIYIRDAIAGKKKLIMKGVSSRSVTSGTRSVISPVVETPEFLFSPENIGGTKSVVGIFQFAGAVLPIAIFKMRELFLNKAFAGDREKSWLINTETLQREAVTPSPKTLDKWTTIKGMEKLVAGYRNKGARHKPIIIEGKYLALMYETDDTYKVYFDIDDCPSSVDRTKLRPITRTDLLYLSLEGVSDVLPALNARYPSCEHGSVFPGFLYLKSTTDSSLKYELDESGNKTDKFVRSFPKLGSRFHEAMCPASRHIERSGADYDGDQMNLVAAFCEESIAETRLLLRSKEFYLDSSGGLFYTAARDTVKLLAESLTSPAFR